MRLIQFQYANGQCAVGVVAADGQTASAVKSVHSMHALALSAIESGHSLAAEVERLGTSTDVLSLDDLRREGRLLPPLTHPDPAHCYVSGTGLTHLGSAAARDQMHQSANVEAAMTDSMRMFKWGVEGGRCADGQPGVPPEWFYKGDGSIVVAPGQALPSPDFALNGGEEPEIVGLYVIGDDDRPHRLGFALGNEFSDHITERKNYLYLAHSKLRPCSIGPELRLGELPTHLQGVSRILRNDEIIWEKTFLTGEANMCHDIANLEYHHFKYAQFLRPGDVHLHFFGTATISIADGIEAREGDVFEISIPEFGMPLSNALGRRETDFQLGQVRML